SAQWSLTSRISRIIHRLEFLDLALRIVLDDDFKRAKHSHHARRSLIEILAQGMLELRDVSDHCALCHAYGFDKVPNRFRRVTGSPKSGQRRHSRVVPTADVPISNKRQQLAFACQRVADVQTGELYLPRA